MKTYVFFPREKGESLLSDVDMSIDVTHTLRDNEDEDDVLTSRKYVTEFEVELTNAHNKTYLVNQLVEGVVRLNLKRPMEIRGQFML